MNPSLTILLMTQPKVVSDVLSNATFRGRGLTARFLYSGRRTLAARYSGTGKDEVIENDHDAIIDPELFAKVQELREISWKKQARRLATNKAKREAEHGKNSNSTAADD